MQQQLIIFGTGVIGDLVAAHFRHDSPWEVAAFTAHRAFIETDRFQGLPLVAFETLEASHPPGEFAVFVALSYSNTNQTRRRAYYECKDKGYSFASYVSPHARSLLPVKHGENVFINESIIQPHARIGNNVMIWSNNVIGHHAVVSDHCFISSGVVISGYVRVGDSCFFGVNSCCRESIEIAEGTIVGAGVTLLRNTKPNELYMAARPTSMKLMPGQEDFLVRRKGVSEPER